MSSQDKPKRSLGLVLTNKIFASAKSAGMPLHIDGIMFFTTDANSLSVEDPTKAKRYRKERFGNAFVLTKDQLDRITAIVAEGRSDFVGNGLEKKDKPNGSK